MCLKKRVLDKHVQQYSPKWWLKKWWFSSHKNRIRSHVTVAKKTLPEGKSSNLQGSRLKDVIRQKHLKFAVQKKPSNNDRLVKFLPPWPKMKIPTHVWGWSTKTQTQKGHLKTKVLRQTLLRIYQHNHGILTHLMLMVFTKGKIWNEFPNGDLDLLILEGKF